MSLTNPNKPVTEARLQEFYHRIKNYLGFTEMPSEDMAEIVTPKPSARARYQKYSTEEQVVGEWIDGKPLYQITFSGTTSESSGGIKDIDLSPYDIKYIASFEGVMSVSSIQCTPIPMNVFSETDKYNDKGSDIWANINGYSNPMLRIRTNRGSSFPFTITIRYTKTTD